MKMTFRVYGMFDGEVRHRNRWSFEPSRDFDFRESRNVTMHVSCADETGTHDYVDVTIDAEDEYSCVREILAQDSDGIFENCRTGKIIDIESGRDVTYDWLNSLR